MFWHILSGFVWAVAAFGGVCCVLSVRALVEDWAWPEYRLDSLCLVGFFACVTGALYGLAAFFWGLS